jgi:hypothetical protein
LENREKLKIYSYTENTRTKIEIHVPSMKRGNILASNFLSLFCAQGYNKMFMHLGTLIFVLLDSMYYFPMSLYSIQNQHLNRLPLNKEDMCQI